MVTIEAIRAIFTQAPFMADLGVQLESACDGHCVTTLALQTRHLQHSGQVHAGVMGTMADHSMGAAAQMLAPEGHLVVTAEYKLSLLRAARGDRLVCRARVAKPGRMLSFTEAEVFCVQGDGSEQLVATASATMAITTKK